MRARETETEREQRGTMSVKCDFSSVKAAYYGGEEDARWRVPLIDNANGNLTDGGQRLTTEVVSTDQVRPSYVKAGTPEKQLQEFGGLTRRMRLVKTICMVCSGLAMVSYFK